MKKYIFPGLILALTSCSISMNMVHTAGTASDVVDTEQKSDADVSPTVSIPVKPL